MAEPRTVMAPTADEAGSRPGSPPARRRVERTRGLPGGRAVVGALLVAAAAVGVFAAYLDAVGEPGTRYLVARGEVEPGTRLESGARVAELFELRPMALDDAVAGRALGEADVDALVGQLVLVPLAPGDLLLRTGVAASGGVGDAHVVSFAIDPAAAVGGRLRAGERVDVLATYGSGESGWTGYVVRGVPITAIDRGEGGTLGSRSSIVLTVAIGSAPEVLALTHAVHTADIVVTRAVPGDAAPTPPPFQPSRQQPVPAAPAGGSGGPEDTEDGPDDTEDGPEDGEDG